MRRQKRQTRTFLSTEVYYKMFLMYSSQKYTVLNYYCVLTVSTIQSFVTKVEV